MFIVNTPDAHTDCVLTKADVHAACLRANLPRLLKVTRPYHSTFFATFHAERKEHRILRSAQIKFPTSSATSASPSELIVNAEPRMNITETPYTFVFACDPAEITTKHQTVYNHIFEALKGPVAALFQLLKQEVAGKIVRYILHLHASAPPIWVERFDVPLDSAEDSGKVWGVYKAANEEEICPACKQRCQARGVSTCNFVMGV